MKRKRATISSAALLVAWLASAGPAGAQGATPPVPVSLTFVTHAAFFSQATHRAPAIDPQIFIRQETLPEGTGPQNIEHVAGERPAQIDDVPELPAYDAHGRSLGFSLGRWFGATGTVVLQRLDTGGERIEAAFSNLLPFGTYSLFRIAFTPAGAVFTPLDGAGTSNSFTVGAEGGAKLAVVTNQPLGSGDAIVLVYHSDGLTHGDSRGDLGLTAHQQLIVRLP
jgi:hypothetical protein